MSKVSVLIPSRYERFLAKTIDDLFAKAAGDIEVCAVLDGYWPDPPLKDRPNLIQLHFTERIGMRGGINAAARIATGDYLLKSDGHCMFDEGFDEKLKADCDDDWIVIPRRNRLEPEAWVIQNDVRPPIDYHFLSYPFERPGDIACGLHGQIWPQKTIARTDILIDDEMSSQGSSYFMKKSYWDHIGPLDDGRYGPFHQEFQEVGNRCWLSGGRVVVNKNTWYAHLHKGKTYGTGYRFNGAEWEQWKAFAKQAHDHTIQFWLTDAWDGRKPGLTCRWLIEKFWPVPTWPTTSDGSLDWDQVMRDYQVWNKQVMPYA